MDTTGFVVQRKKLGRPPKNASLLKTIENENITVSGAGAVAELGDEALVAISPIPEEQVSSIAATAPAATMDTSGECRRSSRKKIIKFDVRDLLNKHRKPHKIQIEARIDSNAPSPPVSSKVTTICAHATETGSSTNSSATNEKCFIEKTSIIQRSMSFDKSQQQQQQQQLPMSLKTQIFKPNQASSLIIAQMESISTPKSIIEMVSKTNVQKKTENAMPKRRGRPPKNRNLLLEGDSTQENLQKKEDANNMLNNKIEKEINDQKTGDVSSQQIQTTENSRLIEKPASPIQNKTIEQNFDTVTRKEDTELVGKTQIKSFQGQFEEALLKREDNFPLKIEAEKLKEIEITSKKVLDKVTFPEPQTATSTYKENTNMETPSVIKNEEDLSIKEKKENTASKLSGMSHITLPIKKQLSKLQGIQAELNRDEPSLLNSHENYTDYTEEKHEISDYNEVNRQTSTPTQTQRERRSGRRLGDDSSNKTLEETFAEIAAKSSKAILELATQKSTENSSNDEIEDNVMLDDGPSRSMSPKEQNLNQESAPIKRRGRPPKSKVVVREDNAVSKDVEEAETEKPVENAESKEEALSQHLKTEVKIQEKLQEGVSPEEVKIDVLEIETNIPNLENCSLDKPKVEDTFLEMAPIKPLLETYDEIPLLESSSTEEENVKENTSPGKLKNDVFLPTPVEVPVLEISCSEEQKIEESASPENAKTIDILPIPVEIPLLESSSSEEQKIEENVSPETTEIKSILETPKEIPFLEKEQKGASTEKTKIEFIFQTAVEIPFLETTSSEKQNLEQQQKGPTSEISILEKSKAKEENSAETSKTLVEVMPTSSSSNQTCDILPVTVENKYKEHKIKTKDRHENLSPARKSKSYHHKHSSSSSSSKHHKSSEREKSYKRSSNEYDETLRKERKSKESSQKSPKGLPKHVEEFMPKTASTPEINKKTSKDKLSDEDIAAKEKIEARISEKLSPQKSHKSLKEKFAIEGSKKSISTSNESHHISTPTKEKFKIEESRKIKEKLGNEVPKKSDTDFKEKYILDNVKKSGGLSASLSEGSHQKVSKTFKQKSYHEDIKKSCSENKEKSVGEAFRKSMESHLKKSTSYGAEISKKLEAKIKLKIHKEKEKTNDNTSQKTYREGVDKFEKAIDNALMNSSKIERKHGDKKKHKIKSLHGSKHKMSVSTTRPTSALSISMKSSSTNSKEQKRKHKSKDSPMEESQVKSEENVSEKTFDSKDEKKQARKERQKQLKEAFEAAIQDVVADKTPNIEKQQEEVPTTTTTTNVVSQTELEPNNTMEIIEIALPPTPGESVCSIDDKEQIVETVSPKSNENKSATTAAEPDPLYDIEKFIEAGVNLLKKDYKLAEDDEVKSKSSNNDATLESMAEKSKDNNEAIEHLNDEDTKSSAALEYYDTPVSTPATISPTSSPTPQTDCSSNSVDTYYYSDGVRRSHRLKKITNAPKALVGRGLVRDRDRERLALRDDVETKSYYSIEDHLMDLAEVEAKNAKFLKDMEERLSNFEVIKENEYHCERIVSREARKMICDCFLTQGEAERGELGCGEDCLNRLLMIECGVNCKVGDRCTNRRFQTFLSAPCRVFRTEKKGFGIMADVEIHPGEFIMEYVGEVLDSDEFEERRVAYSKDKNRHYYFMALRSDAIIDATAKGNVSRFINHSCDPNAETQKWTVNGELRIGFFSRKTIMPGEEITFDYQYQRYGREAQRCYCESANCRGWIGEEPTSDEAEQIDDDEDDDDDEEDDDDEYEEDENDVVSMVKGLMDVEDADEDEHDKDEMSEETRRNIQDAAVKAQLNKKQTESATTTIKEPNLDGESDESKQKFMAYLSKISAKIELHKKNVREEKKRKRQRKRKQASERRQPTTAANARFLEDPDLEDEIDFLSRCGLKNQSDTLRLSRLMVRAKLIPTRLNLLAILRAGELPCRRLFLDYHGLHLLHGWINEDGRTDMTIRMAILETLEKLPIPNKTILTESKVYQAIRGWCSTIEPCNTKTEPSSSSPSDDSSKESNAEKQTTSLPIEPANENVESAKSDLEKLALKLLNSWDNLPEIFRIPKRERIEQMKEHEREADRQYAATVEAEDTNQTSENNEKQEISTDRYQRDRFERRFGRPQGARTISVVGGAGSLKRIISSDIISPEHTKHLSKEQRRELFAAKVARDEAEKRQAESRRQFETKCSFFGLDPLTTRPEDIPFCVSDAGKWYNERRQIIPTPPAFAHVPIPTKPMSTNPADYFLPSATKSLPPEWAFAITEQGKIYYYHLKHRIPQWEPPTLEQINKTKWSDGESDSGDDIDDDRELSEEKIKEIEAIETQEDLTAYLKKIVQEQRKDRYKRLVDERPISPRREEDRIYNQMEMRKYKENKEKIKKRKEEIRRRRSEAIKNSMLNMCTLGSLDEKPNTSADGTKTEVDSGDLPENALPIQDYLLSSDEDNNDIDEMKAECNNSPLLDKIVQGDKIVDELDALTTKRQLKRPLPPHRDFNFDLNSSATTSNDSSLHSNFEKMEYKKRKQEKKEKSKRSKESSDMKYKKLKEKFRCEIAGIIVQHLKPYRKDSCVFGRIKSNEDFNHLAKKLTHFVMIKELKYCESVGQTLVVTESVKNKSREFIRKYMAKYQAGYVKSNNDPEFKDIPFTL